MSQSKSTLAGEQTSTNPTAPVKNIVDTMIDAGYFTTLAAGLKAAGLTNTLAGKGPFTVFAPTDAAFKKLPAGAVDALRKDSAKLKAVLNYHMIPGHVTVRDMKSGDVMTQQGSTMTTVVSGSEVQVNGAHVKRTDVFATNGIIHEIDAVIMPRNWQLLATAA
jgi:transforming growth factor-beta-induced protein